MKSVKLRNLIRFRIFFLSFACLGLSIAPVTWPDSFAVSDIKHLLPADLERLKSNHPYEALEELFGPYTRADSYAIGWPKAIHRELESKEKWRRAHWFFYKMNERGRPIYPITLDFVASLPESAEDIDKSWMSLLPEMIVDWPPEKAGKTFEEMFETSERNSSDAND